MEVAAAQSGEDAAGSLPSVVGSLTVTAEKQQVEDLTVLCALQQSCVMLAPDTSLAEALQV
jgi:hypothetical protein